MTSLSSSSSSFLGAALSVLVFGSFCLPEAAAAASKPAQCLRCITYKPSFSADKATCTAAVECDLPGQCFKAIFNGGLTIRGCPRGNGDVSPSNVCEHVKSIGVTKPGAPKSSFKQLFDNKKTKDLYDAACSKTSTSRSLEVHLCRGVKCNGAGGMTASIIGVFFTLVAALFGTTRRW